MTTEPPDADILNTQSEPFAATSHTPEAIHEALRSGRNLRAAVAQTLGITEQATKPSHAPDEPGGGSSDDDDDDEGEPHDSRGYPGVRRENRATAGERRQMFRMIQSYYKADAEKFHGRDQENIEEFLETYESLFSIAGMPLSLAVEMMPYVVADAAKDFLRMSPGNLPWTELRRLFTKQYASAARRQRLSQRYQTLCQQTATGLDSYYKQLIDITRQLPSAYRTPDLMRDKFISGLHESIREAVTLVDPPDLQAAYDRAKMVFQARKPRPSVTQRVPRRAPWKRTPGNNGRASLGKDRALLASRGTPAEVICWQCGEPGHYQSAHRTNGTSKYQAREKPGNDGRKNWSGRQL